MKTKRWVKLGAMVMIAQMLAACSTSNAGRASKGSSGSGSTGTAHNPANGGGDTQSPGDGDLTTSGDGDSQAESDAGAPGASCGEAGSSCSSSSDCCGNVFCIQGTCGECSNDAPQYCPQLGGQCWYATTACDTLTECSDGTKGCSSPSLTVDCDTNQCLCPNDYPVWCDPDGSLPGDCWSEGTDCTTRVACAGDVQACGRGYTYDCGSEQCVSNVPDWLVGEYWRSGKTENNVYFTSENRSIEFRADGTYTHQLGSASASSGTFTIDGDTLAFDTGPLSTGTLSLSGNFSSSCRVLTGFGSPLWRHEEVASCPAFSPVSDSECYYVGTYQKSEYHDYTNDSGDGTTTSRSWTVTLFHDHFYTYDDSSDRTTCYQGNCVSLANSPQTSVGSWSPSGGDMPFTLSQLTAWEFSPSSEACP